MKCVRFSQFVAALAVSTTLLPAVAAAQQAQPNPAAIPAACPDAWWHQRHEGMNARVKQGNVGLIFIGDSITHGWEADGKDVWQKFYAKRNAVNLGISGDQTTHVLWRLDHGNIDGISPKLAVMMIGTNNAGNHSPERTAAGIKAIVEKLRSKLPETKVLLLAIFPRGADDNDGFRRINVKTNEIISKLADGEMVFFLDIGPKFVRADGTLSKDVMPDLLHLNAKSYQTWAEAIEPTVAKLMGEKPQNQQKPPPLITHVLGTILSDDPSQGPDVLEQAAKDISDKGFTLSWDASPPGWLQDILQDAGQLAHLRRCAKLLHAHGMGAAFGFSWGILLPGESTAASEAFPWRGETLNPQTGAFHRENWDFGSEEARREFVRRAGALFKAVGEPFEMFVSDEVTLGSPGEDSDRQRISTYWTSPTYSVESLASFRAYLAKAGYAGAGTARFPVTTVAAAKSGEANAGLPAVPLSDANRERLVADNNWPASPLWRHWYAWREDLYAAWLDAVTTTAYQTWGHRPEWLGCMYEMPTIWRVTGLGQNIEKIIARPHVDYLVSGYRSGQSFQDVKAVAERAGKRWGIAVDLCHYGTANGSDPEDIRQTFKNAVQSGASVVTCYAGCNFRTDRKNLAQEMRNTGAYYMPKQIAAWADCIQWLKGRQGYLRAGAKS